MQMAPQLNPNHQNKKKTTDTREQRFEIHAAGNGGSSSGGVILIVGCCALIAAGIGAAFAARRARNEQRKSDKYRRVEDGVEGFEAERKLEESEIPHVEGFDQEEEEQVSPAELPFEIVPNLEKMEIANVLNPEEEIASTKSHEEETESSSACEKGNGVNQEEEIISVKLHEGESESQVWPELETTGHVLDISQVGDDDNIEERLKTPHIYHIEVDHITKEDDIVKRIRIPVTELHVNEQEEEFAEEENGVRSIQSSCAIADCIQQEQVLTDDLDGVKEVDTDTDITEDELDAKVKDAGSLAEELGSYHFDKSSKILSDDLENATIEEDEKTSIKSAEHEREVLVKEEGSKSKDDAIHPSELMNISISVSDNSVVALAETEYDGKPSAALEKFLNYTNPGQGEFSADSLAEIQAVETLVTQSVSKNSEMVKELGGKMDNGDCVAKEFSTIGEVSYMFQDEEKQGVIQESSEQFQAEENGLFTEVGRSVEDSEISQDSSRESCAEEVLPEMGELSSSERKEVEQVGVPKSTVGIEQVKEEHGVIQETSMESSAEKESSSIDLENIEEAEASKRTNDMVSIERVKEGDGAEDADVVQESSSESSTEEIFPYHNKELPSIDFKNIKQVEAIEEEHEECEQKVASEVTDDNSSEIQAVETLVTQSISSNSEMAKELGAKMDNDNCVGKEFSTIGVISYMFQDQEKPGVIHDSSEQLQKEENELFTEVGRSIEGSEIVQDSAVESSAEEVFPEKEELSSVEWKEVEQVDVPKSTDNLADVPKSTADTVGIEQVKEHRVIQESSSTEKESSPIDLKNIEVEASKRTDDMVSIEQVEGGGGAEDADVVQESSTELSADEIFPCHVKELASIDFKNIEQVVAVTRTVGVVDIEQAEEEQKECKQRVASEVTDNSPSEIQAIETLVTQSISKNSEMIEELGAKIENDDCVAKGFSTIGVISYMFQDQENPEVIQDSLEQFQAEENGLFTEVGRSVEDSEISQDGSRESCAEEVFPEKGELSSIEWKEVEQVGVPKSSDGTVGIEQVKEEHGVIQETSMEPSEEKESSSIDLKNIEEVEASKRTNDMVSIEQHKEGDGAEDVDVVRDSSTESSAKEIFPYHDKELPSIDFKNIEQVEALKRTDDVVAVEQAKEEHVECKQKVSSEVADDSSSEIQAIKTLVTQSISKNSEMIKELGAKLENDDCVAKETSTIGVVSYMFQDQENPEVIQQSLEQFQAEENELFTEVGRSVKGSEVIQGSAMESSTEEIFPEKEEEEEELPSIESKKLEQVEVPKSTDDTVGIEQVKEEHGAIQETFMGSSAEKESLSIELQNTEQVEAVKRTDDTIGIEQVEEGDGAEDADVVLDSSTESSTEQIFPDQDKELPSNDFKNIKQVEAVKRADDAVGIEQAVEEHEECEHKVATKVDFLLMSSNYKVFILLLLALGLALGLLTFAQPDSLRHRDHRLPEMYHKLYQLFFRSYRAVVDI